MLNVELSLQSILRMWSNVYFNAQHHILTSITTKNHETSVDPWNKPLRIPSLSTPRVCTLVYQQVVT